MVLLMLKATPKWWVMSKEYRLNMFKNFFYPILSNYTDSIQINVFNAEAFHSKVSDFIVLETTELDKYYEFLQDLKASKLFAREYFELQDIIMGVENGFKEFYENKTKEQALFLN